MPHPHQPTSIAFLPLPDFIPHHSLAARFALRHLSASANLRCLSTCAVRISQPLSASTVTSFCCLLAFAVHIIQPALPFSRDRLPLAFRCAARYAVVVCSLRCLSACAVCISQPALAFRCCQIPPPFGYAFRAMPSQNFPLPPQASSFVPFGCAARFALRHLSAVLLAMVTRCAKVTFRGIAR